MHCLNNAVFNMLHMLIMNKVKCSIKMHVIRVGSYMIGSNSLLVLTAVSVLIGIPTSWVKVGGHCIGTIDLFVLTDRLLHGHVQNTLLQGNFFVFYLSPTSRKCLLSMLIIYHKKVNLGNWRFQYGITIPVL